MIRFLIAAVAALSLAGAAMADPINVPAGPYKLDAAGKCHAANGKFVDSSMCHAGPAKHCVKGKACGNTCIKATDVCHKPS